MRGSRAKGPEREVADITIHLSRVPQGAVGSKDVYFKTVQDAYANRYLQSLGVEPSEHNRRLVAQNAPLGRCEIEASWSGGSAVASELRIVQPALGGTRSAKAEKTDVVPDADDETLRELELRHGPMQYLSTKEPSVPDAATIAQRLAHASSPGHETDGLESDAYLAASQARDWWPPEREQPEMVEELERVRRVARGEAAATDGVPTLVRWGEDGEREIELLKRKWILPFAAQRPAKEGRDETHLVPWQSPELAAPVHVPTSLHEEVVKPLAITADAIHHETASYVGKRFPLELLTTRRDPWFFSALRDRLCSPEAVQLNGLLAHLAYWTMFAHVHRPMDRLPESARQTLNLKVQELWTGLVKPARARDITAPMRRSSDSADQAALFVRPVCLVVAKRMAEKVLQLNYPRLFQDFDHGEALSQRICDGINVMMMHILDPDCQYASFGVLNSSLSAMRLERNLSVAQMKHGLTPANRMISSCFRTTPLVTLLMNSDGGGPESPKARRLLLKSSSETVLCAVSGADSPSGRREARRGGIPVMEAKRRAALYRTACTRFQASGAVISGAAAPVKAEQDAPTEDVSPGRRRGGLQLKRVTLGRRQAISPRVHPGQNGRPFEAA